MMNFLISENKTLLDYNNDEPIILFRTICCGISIFFCFLLILVYFILFLQVKFNICIKNDVEEKSLLDNDLTSENSSDKSKNNNKKGKIGLGSNFMFLLTISNFFGSIFEFMFYFYYINKKNDALMNYKQNIEFKIYEDINNDEICHLFGFAHNFFDLFTVCWISMLTLLFYRSTNLSNEMLYHDNKYLIIGFTFSIISCLIFCGIPYITDSYGFARYYCSFRYYECDNVNDPFREETINSIWRWCFVCITGLNNLFNAICLFKTSKFYSRKLKLIKTQNKKEYKIMLIYVWVFRIFPIVLLISRFFKGISRVMINYGFDGITIDIFEYINGFLFASNGIFDSIACIFFFRGVFWCCSNNTTDERISDAKECADFNNLSEINEMNME